MKNIFQSLSIATLLGLFVPFISSCSDDEEVLTNGMLRMCLYREMTIYRGM